MHFRLCLKFFACCVFNCIYCWYCDHSLQSPMTRFLSVIYLTFNYCERFMLTPLQQTYYWRLLRVLLSVILTLITLITFFYIKLTVVIFAMHFGYCFMFYVCFYLNASYCLKVPFSSSLITLFNFRYKAAVHTYILSNYCSWYRW